MNRNTIQRMVVNEAVHKLKNHATAEEVYSEVRKAHPHISKGTVYRNLNRLCEEGEIMRRKIPGEADRYDHECSLHYHGKCVECGEVFDLDVAYLKELDHFENLANGFLVFHHDIVFDGICKACRK